MGKRLDQSRRKNTNANTNERCGQFQINQPGDTITKEVRIWQPQKVLCHFSFSNLASPYPLKLCQHPSDQPLQRTNEIELASKASKLKENLRLQFSNIIVFCIFSYD